MSVNQVMLKRLGSRLFNGGKFLGNQKLKCLIIDNPVGFQATKVSIFSEHIQDQPRAHLRGNKDTYLTDVKVYYPKNTLVGVDIYYEPTSTLGLLHEDLAPRSIKSYAIYNHKLHKLQDLDQSD